MKNLYLLLIALLFCVGAHATVAPITGLLNACYSYATVLSDATPGGTWSSSNESVATITPSGVVVSTTTGTARITYTITPGIDYATAVVTINPLPAPISGAAALCVGSTTTVSSTSSSGIWSNTNPGIAAIDGMTGIVTGVAPGTSVITYALGTGCRTTMVVTVYALPGIIAGPTSVCAGSVVTLSSYTGGGTWTSSASAVAGVGITTGVVSGISSGTTMITYTVGTGCASTTIVTVNPLPGAISGTPNLCVGTSTTLSSVTSGGTWSSSAGVITIGSSTGVITGVALGTALVTYTLLTGCIRTQPIIVNPLPAPITGSGLACVGKPISLGGGSPGGTWSSSNAGVANIVGGAFYGLSVGTTVISYTLPTGCVSTKIVTVNSSPAAITGVPKVCVGSTTTLSCTPVGGIWSSSTPSIAIVGSVSGVVTGYYGATATIYYTSSNGCASTVIVTVSNTSGPITGPGIVCVGNTMTEAGSVPGGSWSSSDISAATVNSAGVVSGLVAGTTVLSYNQSACTVSLATTIVTINANCTGTPTAGTTVAGSAVVCLGSPATLSLSAATTLCGISRQWQNSTDNVTWTDITGATSTAYTQSPAVTKYYRCALTCDAGGSTAYSAPAHVAAICTLATHTIITAPDTACSPSHFYITACGVSSALTAVTYFGDGNSSTTALTSTGVCNAHIYHTYVMPGTYTVKHVLYDGATVTDSVSYTYNNLYCHTLPLKFYFDANSNCVFDGGEHYNMQAVTVKIDSNGTPIDTVMVTSGLYRKVYGLPGTVYGFTVLPVVGSLFASCPSSGVIYDTVQTYSNTYATKYFGLSCSATSSYDLSLNTSMTCGRHMANGYITVNNGYCLPVSPTVTMTFSNDYVYSSGYPVPASVSGNTVTWNLSLLSASSTSGISFTLNHPGDMADWLIPGDTVNSMFTVTPTGGDANPTDNVCIRIDTVKSSYDPNDMVVSPEGYALPCTPLEYTVRFENTGNDTAHNIYVLDTLSADMDPGTLNIVTASAAMSLSVITDGTWNIARFDFAGINLLDSSHHGECDGMLVYTIKSRSTAADGAAIINRVGIYFDSNPVVMTNSVTNTSGLGPLTGGDNMCVGSGVTLANTIAGGIWSSAATAVATAGSTGVVTSVAAGITAISYAVSNSCVTKYASKVVTVNDMPAVITGNSAVCMGGTTMLSSTPAGGTWSSSVPANATIDESSGLVTGLNAGTSGIIYTLLPGCTATLILTVNFSGGTLRGCNNIGVGDTIQLNREPTGMSGSGISGGFYSSSNPSVCDGLGNGYITGNAAGVATISSYTGAGCIGGTITVTVTPTRLIAPITGTTTVCPGNSVTLSSAALDGIWSSSDPSVATINADGVVNSLVNGFTIITYSVLGGTYSCSQSLWAPWLPDPIVGSSNVCMGDLIYLSSAYCGYGTDVCLGGYFYSGDTSIAKIYGNNVSGEAPGTAVITFQGAQWPGCARSTIITVNPSPSSASISSTSALCIDASRLLTNTVPGGIWTSEAIEIATVSSGGLLRGISAGTVTISYLIDNSCGSAVNTVVVTIDPVPDAGITGSPMVCAGSATSFSSIMEGGAWSSSALLIAGVSSTGIVTGETAGEAIITYAITNSCGYEQTIQMVTVSPLPFGGVIAGTAALCEGTATTLSNFAAGGVWAGSATDVATVDLSGVVSGISAGTTSISYIVMNSCGSAYAVKTITVNPLPVAGSITGAMTVCSDAMTMLSNAAGGGTWSTGGTSIATIDGSGLVTGISAGTANISYLVSNGCGSALTAAVITVNPLPFAGTISGVVSVCPGMITTLANAAPGGVWSSSAAGVATAESTGVITGITAGTTVISYAHANSCGTAVASTVVTVNPLPVAGTVTAPATLCVGTTTMITNTVTGGVWSSNSAGIASIGSSGMTTGVSAGIAIITYTASNDCGTDLAIAFMLVDSNYIPSVAISTHPGTTIAPGTSDTFSAVTSGAGPLPTYQWIINGSPVTGATNSVFISSSLVNGDSVSCTVTGSGPCGLDGFNSVVITVDALGVRSLSDYQEIAIYPNPNNGGFYVKGSFGMMKDEAVMLTVTDMLGQEVYRNGIMESEGKIDVQVVLNNTLANGMYMLCVQAQSGSKVLHFVVEK